MLIYLMFINLIFYKIKLNQVGKININNFKLVRQKLFNVGLNFF